tara:strand:- start:551 stop:931 length:381 start_codon:yes stop_codon:yes gene_type:complete
MKNIFIILLLLPVVLFTQTVDTCFTEEQIHNISETLDSLYYLDSVNNKIILEQEVLISDLEKVIILDSLENLYLNQKNEFLNDNINLYIERENLLQPKWYDKKGLWFSAGILTTLLTGKLIVEVVQ